MVEAKKQGKVHYGASGTQRGGRVNFVGVGSSTKGNLGDSIIHKMLTVWMYIKNV